MAKEFIENRLFVVTGAAGGIGREIVRLLLKSGAYVLATDLDEIELQAMKEGYDRHKDSLFIQKLDVTSDRSWNSTMETVSNLKKTFYGLINSSGYLKPGPLTDISVNDIDLHLNINTKGVILGCTHAARYLKKEGSGHIINLASLASITPIPGIGLYSASKFALRGYSLVLAEELRRFGVFVSVVCPDAVKTDMITHNVDNQDAAIVFSGGEPLSPQEVARDIVDLIGKDRVEVLIPGWRGALAKVNNLIPDLSQFVVSQLNKSGEKK